MLLRNFISRFKGLLALICIYVAIAMFTRTYLTIYSHSDIQWGLWKIIKIYFTGLFYDIISVSYFLIPLAFFNIILTDKGYQARWRIITARIFYVLLTALIIFGAFAEYFFWEEFGTRFNFIAIDYLIYTTEVTNNINESYNIPVIFSSIIIITSVISFFAIRYKWYQASAEAKTTFVQRLKLGAIFFVFPVVAFFTIGQNIENHFNNRYNGELAKNGVYSLFSAYINNELDYMKFYSHNEDKQAFADVMKLMETANSTSISNEPFDLQRKISTIGEEKKYNVILICDESLSASYLGCFGNNQGLSPNLDSLSKQSLFFTNLYATGTRTVRGMEALTLSIPPTPGSSLVRRPDNENLFSLGSVFNNKGYDVKFLYGGYGYFDNMNYFFGHNGFSIVDRNELASNEITFANAWGVCDEDIFARSVKEADQSTSSGKPFFQYIMTTSNHRPYTYPEGRINIPSHQGREGGVKYTDFAIGKFLRDARNKPWFKNTIFVIVADHCGNSAGKTSMDIEKYHIPMFVYNPEIIKPQSIDLQCSQIDVAPTLLGLLNWSYETKFFGKNILNMKPEEQRALIGTYQKLGYIKGNKVAILDVQRRNEFYTYDKSSNTLTPSPADPQMLNEIIAYYQSAYYMNKHKLNKK
jgi:phosphoglycerol transferase MdoB-like AlkP superfamily enzyme